MSFHSTIQDESLADEDIEQAATMLTRSLEVRDEQLDDFAMGLSYFESEDYALAIESLRQVPPNPPIRFAWAQEWLGQTYMKLERYELAIESLQRALQIHELLDRYPLMIAECQFSLGLAFAHSGQHELALAEFRQALRRAPDWSIIHFEEARLHTQSNRKIECLSSLIRAINEDRQFYDKAKRDPDLAHLLQSPQFLRLWLRQISQLPQQK